MPVRAIPRNYRSVTGRLFIPGQGHVAFESTLERDFIILCWFTPGFVAIEEQPVAVPYGRGRRYVPDFLVTWAGGRKRELVEVKPEAVLAEKAEELAPRLAAARRLAADNGWAFRMATEKHIRTSRLDAARFLLSFRDRAVEPGLCRRLVDGLADGKARCLDALLGTVFPDPDARTRALPALWHLVATFRIAVDLDRPLTMHSEATLAHGGAR